ncbi:MAG: TetR/AcrR family transcriptional regulator [Acholeplasmatales bacterium]|nr:MAG: TetR/AcrR family transcriptional regulator [Acholeplasmatales bacterium]
MPKPRFERLPEAKKRALRQAITAVFNTRGYDNTTVSDIVAATKMARGSFYAYYHNRLDVFMDLMQSVQTDKMAVMTPLLAQLGHVPFLEVFPDIARAGIRFAKAHPAQQALGRLLYLSTDPDMRTLRQTVEKQGVAIYTGYIKQDQDAGAIAADVEAAMVARLLYRFIAFDLLEAFYEHGDEARLMTMVDQTMRIIRHGIQKEGVS